MHGNYLLITIENYIAYTLRENPAFYFLYILPKVSSEENFLSHKIMYDYILANYYSVTLRCAEEEEKYK